MDVQQLIDDPETQALLAAVRRDCAGRRYSDIVDDAGHQYVDLVMEGGGMLGIALVGYTWMLEQLDIRFLGIGGTSAGSINALLIAALGTPAQAKSPKLLQLLANQDFFEFVDGDRHARRLIRAFLDGKGTATLIWRGLRVLDDLRKRLGLNPGDAFLDWLTGVLRGEGIHTVADLRARMRTLPPGLRHRDGAAITDPAEAGIQLALVAADVTTETKVDFPRLAPMYFEHPEAVNPALFARASMSIPYFFRPLRLGGLPRGEEALKHWWGVGIEFRREQVPDEVLFVDGGILSNFPIDLFHDTSRVPAAPTFGAKLELDQRHHRIDGPVGLGGAMFNAARHCLDYDFIHRNPDYKQLVTWIPCHGYNWLDFEMSDAQKIGLFKDGVREAANFLRRFDWERYKRIRAGVAGAAAAARAAEPITPPAA